MKRLRFLYHMQIDFDTPVKGHHFTLKCIPKDNSRQQIEELSYTVYPNRFISHSVDSFGNECLYGMCEEPHKEFLIEVNGIAECAYSDYESECSQADADVFKYQTVHTIPGESIKRYYEELSGNLQVHNKGTVEEKVKYYMNRLHSDYVYQSGSTEITTTAEEAFLLGYGVCQDYAHILICILRMDKIPCRYVTGMMLGDGLSHAWVEYYFDGRWIAVDPTNEQVVRDEHIRIAAGRDYKDCLINQGVFVGCEGKVIQKQSIRVNVEEI